jgi:uncharacterized caspase-like protein
LFLQHQESRPGDPAAGLSETVLASYLQKTAGKVVLLLDVIDNDAIGTPGNSRERRSLDDLVRLLGTDEYGVTAISATTAREASKDMPSGGHSVFAQAILNGLAGKADANSDGTIDVKEFSQYVRSDVKKLTSDAQRPAISHPSLVHHFPLFRLP